MVFDVLIRRHDNMLDLYVFLTMLVDCQWFRLLCVVYWFCWVSYVFNYKLINYIKLLCFCWLCVLSICFYDVVGFWLFCYVFVRLHWVCLFLFMFNETVICYMRIICFLLILFVLSVCCLFWLDLWWFCMLLCVFVDVVCCCMCSMKN